MKSPTKKRYRFGLAKQAFVMKEGRLVDHLRELYKRPNLAIKVFDYEHIENEEDFKTVKWGDDPQKGQPKLNTTIWEATQIQNICAFEGLAPRVYALTTVFLAGKYVPAQLVEYVDEPHKNTHQEAEVIYDQVIELGKKYGFSIEKKDVSSADVRGSKLIDFQTFSFNKPYKETVKEIYINSKYGKIYYQDVPELGLSSGPRKSVKREKELSLHEIDFKGKYVLDVGCAGGYFTRLATDKGASYVLGIDIDPEHIKAARHLANLLGYFNNEYVVADLDKNINEAMKGQFDWWDITFFLSMNYHVKNIDWVKNHNREVLIFEDNGKVTRNQFLHDGSKYDGNIHIGYKHFDYKGKCSDHGSKPIYHLRKE